ncbi:MAG: NAD(P)H-hydrate dehydratase [Acetivibrio sp.]
MKYLVDGRQMKAIDRYTIEQIGIPSLVLMEKAAMATAMVILDYAKSEDRVLAVCGQGNNGGDGIAVARILKEAGLDTSVLFVGNEEKASEETKRQLQIGRNLNLPIFISNGNFKENFNIEKIREYTVIVDAVFGIGLSKAVTGVQEEIIKAVNQSRAKKFSVDIPSGIHAETGQVMGNAVKADITVTFGYLKLGLILYPGAEYAGEVIKADIGFPKMAEQKLDLNTFTYDLEDKKRLPMRNPYSNKGNYGRVLIIGGAKNMAGAAYLAGFSAYCAGAGLVKILTCEENRVIIQSCLPEALLSTYTEESFNEDWFMQELKWATTVAIGPGLGTGTIAERMLKCMVEKSEIPTVMDADGLNLLAQNGGLEAIRDKKNIVITPHVKEMARLCDCMVSQITHDILSFTKEVMKDKKFTLVLKDARTLVVEGVRTYVNRTGNAGMAVGGSGDVLTGVIAGLIGQGMEVMEGSALGVYIHGLAGDRVAGDESEYSILAGDIARGLKKEINRDERIL